MFGTLASILGMLAKTGMLKDLAEVVIGSRVQRDAQAAQARSNDHDEMVAIHNEQAAGFRTENRTWFDVFVDGMNRLVRPLGSYGVFALFVWAAVSPASFTVTMKALDVVPQMLWTIMAMVVGFWWGSRLLAQDIPTQAAKRSAIDQWKASRSQAG